MNEPISTSAWGILRRVFHGLEEPIVKELRQVARRNTYEAGTVLCRQGEREHTFYIVVDGRVAVTQRLEDGEERLLGIRGPNEYFGEMGLLDNAPRMATCTTLVSTTVLEVTEDSFDHLVEASPAVAFALTRQLLKTLRNLDTLAIEDLQAKNEALRQAYLELQAAQVALVEKERLERELEIAADVQRKLLPASLPAYEDYRFAAYLDPARQVGGDLYDVMELDDEHLGLLIADVADKSVHAALFMAVSRTLFLVESARTRSPVAVAEAVHRGLLAVSPSADTFVTAIYGVLHRPSGLLRYVVAGHERPLRVRPGEATAPLHGEGRFLGMLPDLRLREYQALLQPGDHLVLFSDGVPDATSPQGERYGTERLTRLLDMHLDQGAGPLVESIREDLAAWIEDAAPFDDLTLLVVERVMRTKS